MPGTRYRIWGIQSDPQEKGDTVKFLRASLEEVAKMDVRRRPFRFRRICCYRYVISGRTRSARCAPLFLLKKGGTIGRQFRLMRLQASDDPALAGLDALAELLRIGLAAFFEILLMLALRLHMRPAFRRQVAFAPLEARNYSALPLLNALAEFFNIGPASTPSAGILTLRRRHPT